MYVLEMLTASGAQIYFFDLGYMTFVQGQFPYMVIGYISLELITDVKLSPWDRSKSGLSFEIKFDDLDLQDQGQRSAKNVKYSFCA